jgi:predicted lysophospholipase L1 biosynthesis ABC-type transport system permease subunit
VTWPAVNISPQRLGALDTYMLLVATDGPQAVEQARTVLWNAYPDYPTPETFAEQAPGQPRLDREYQQLADVIVLVSLVIAGCTLATAVAGGLAERKRPFSLLRLTGAPLGLLQRVVALESAVPLVVTAAVSIGVGFAASAMFAKAQLERPMAGPDPA